jgi:hypothetical protein
MVGTLEAPSSSSSSSSGTSWRQRLNRAAAANNGEDNDDHDIDDARQADGSSSGIDRRLLQQPYLQTVVQHLRQTGALADKATTASNGSSSGSGSSSNDIGSSSSGRGRGAKRGVARSLLEAHTSVFQAALDLELQEEWSEAEQRLQVSITLFATFVCCTTCV